MRKLVIWGTGIIYHEFIEKMISGEIVALIESKANQDSFEGKKVYQPEVFAQSGLEYDNLIIANAFTNEIFQTLVALPIDMKKVVFLRPLENRREVEIYNRNLEVLKEIAPEYLTDALRESGKRMGIDSLNMPLSDYHPVYYYDYFRYRTFELVADQIKDLKGDIAELGVYKGNFAKLINQKLSESTFYLFDTFEGFNKEEAAKELNAGNCDEYFIETFTQTSVESVKKLLKYPDQCIFRKGFFPETAIGIDTEFKFVSIDVDFEDSTYEGLKYFYPRLVKGGYIFIHDYNEGMLKGVKKAVERFEKENGSVIKVPIADKCGTLVITR